MNFTELSNFQVKFRLDEEFFLQPGQVLPLGLPGAELGLKYEITARTALRVENRYLIANAKNKKLSQHPLTTEVAQDEKSELHYPGGIRYMTPSLDLGLSCSRLNFMYSPMLAKTFADYTEGFIQKHGSPFELVACSRTIPDGSTTVYGYNVVTGKTGKYYTVPIPIVLSEPISVWDCDKVQIAIESYLRLQNIIELGLFYRPVSNAPADTLMDTPVRIVFYDKKKPDSLKPAAQPVLDHNMAYRLRLFQLGRFNADLL